MKKTHKKSIQTKFIIVFVVLLIGISVSTGVITYQVSYDRITREFSKVANATELASCWIDGDKVEGWLENGADSEYYAVEAQLRDLKKL